MTKESIVAKVKKLMAIAENDSSSDAEIDNALDFAKTLMDNHHLTEDDLTHEPADDYQKVNEAEKGLFRCFVGSQFYTWENLLACFVSAFVGCPWYIGGLMQVRSPNGFLVLDDKGKPKKGKAIVFYGVAEDAQIAQDVFNELRALIATMAVAKWGSVYRGDGAAYSEGFVDGLTTKLETKKVEEKQDSSNTSMILLSHRRDALIAYKQAVAKQWLAKEYNIKLRTTSRSGGSNGSWLARGQGREDGKSTEVAATRLRKLG